MPQDGLPLGPIGLKSASLETVGGDFIAGYLAAIAHSDEWGWATNMLCLGHPAPKAGPDRTT